MIPVSLRQPWPRCVWIALAVSMPALSAARAEDGPNTHNMAIVGTTTAYVSHLPMFDGVDPAGTAFTAPHRFQVIMAVDFKRGGRDANALFAADRQRNPKAGLYTLGPSDEFILTRLVKGAPKITHFTADVFRGHLEKGGKVVDGLGGVDVAVRRIVHFREFDPKAVKPKDLRYILFGGGGETFLAHYVSGPPDFDQLLAVKVDGPAPTDKDLANGIVLSVEGRANTAAKRLTGPVAAKVTTLAAAGAPARSFTLTPVREIYFEEGELFVPPQMRPDTPLERAASIATRP